MTDEWAAYTAANLAARRAYLTEPITRCSELKCPRDRTETDIYCRRCRRQRDQRNTTARQRRQDQP